MFQTLYCFVPETETLDPLAIAPRPRPNDFSDFSEYFLKKVSTRFWSSLTGVKSMVGSLASLGDRASRGLVWRNVRQLLLDLLSFNDNTHNKVILLVFKYLPGRGLICCSTPIRHIVQPYLRP